jgi:hypothetical protein
LFLKFRKNRRKIVASALIEEEERSHEREEKREKTTNIRLSFNFSKGNYYSTILWMRLKKLQQSFYWQGNAKSTIPLYNLNTTSLTTPLYNLNTTPLIMRWDPPHCE